jgi:hypothetical protein
MQCGTQLVWLGDEMWLEADRWSFQKVGLAERDDLLYRSMTAAELRKLAGEQPPYTAPPDRESPQAIPPPVWIEMAPAAEEPVEESLPGEFEEEVPLVEEQEPQPDKVAGATVAGAAIVAQRAAAETPAAEDLVPAAQPSAEQQAPSPEAIVGAAAIGAAARSQAEATEQGLSGEGARQPAADTVDAPTQPAIEEQAQPDTLRAETPGSGDAPGEEPSPGQGAQPRRRSQGSPFLVISVGLVLLCLICSAAAMVIYSMWDRLPPGSGPAATPPAGEAQPGETVIPTDTLFPTETPAPEPTEVPPEVPGGVEFQGVTDYLSSTGSHYLVGEVLNQTSDTLRFVEVLATFYDGNGQEVGTGSTFTELGIIEAGSTAPFKMTIPDPSAMARYDLRVDSSTTTQPPIRLEVVGHSGSASDTGWYHVTGEVRNPHGFAIKFPEIVATYYNAAHKVVRVEVDFAQVDPLEPGQSSAFEVVLTDPPADLMHYTLQTEAVQQ